MKYLLLIIGLFPALAVFTQITCLNCYDQKESISSPSANLITNGGFENSSCALGEYFCPASGNYTCDINNWTVSGGGNGTYAQMFSSANSIIVEGTRAAYLGNYFADICPSADTACIDLSSDACSVTGVPDGYPTNTANYGGNTGVSIEQTVNNLTVGESYNLEFWVGGEGGGSSFLGTGVFGLDIGFGQLFLKCHTTGANSSSTGTRYIIQFLATSTSHNIKFTNWGHITYASTEIILDDVILYKTSDPASNFAACEYIPDEPTTILDIPNVFTPNSDQVNDFFEIDYSGTDAYNIVIMNRWGNVVFESDDKTIHWDGTIGDSDAAEGVYYYKLSIGDEITHGFLHLIR